MKLYYSPGACSTSCHISLEESGFTAEAIALDWDNPEHVSLIKKLNPLDTLPIMVLDSGKVLNQNIAIHSYIAERAAGKNLFPKSGTEEHAEAMGWLSFVAADLHKSFSVVFGAPYVSSDAKIHAEVRKFGVNGVDGYLKYLNENLTGKDYILGKNFSVIDSYAFVVLGWTKFLEIPTKAYSNIEAYMARVASRPAVQKVLKTEGLI